MNRCRKSRNPVIQTSRRIPLLLLPITGVTLLSRAKTAGHVVLDFIGYYDAKAALTGVDENGNMGRAACVRCHGILISKPVKGVKIAAKYGDDVLRYGKGYVDYLARKSEKVACGCPNGINQAGKAVLSVEDLMKKGKPGRKTMGKSKQILDQMILVCIQ